MANEILFNYGTAIVWADSADYSSTVSGLARTHQIDLTSLGSNAARQGAKADLGDLRPQQYVVLAGIEFDVAPTSGEVVSLWWAGSPSATAGNANPGGTSGADAAYTGTAGDSLDDSIRQLQHLGNLIATADAATTVQFQQIGVVSLVPRYGMPVVYNQTGQALEGDAVEMYVALIPLTDEIQ